MGCWCSAAGWKRLWVAGDDTELGCELDGAIQHGIGASRPTFHSLGYTANWASGGGCGCHTRRIWSRGRLRILGPVLGALEFHRTRRICSPGTTYESSVRFGRPRIHRTRQISARCHLSILPPGLKPRVHHTRLILTGTTLANLQSSSRA